MVSIIVACYNCEKYIEKCIDSLINQTYKNIEIIICDDASTDASYSILKRLAEMDDRIILLKNSKCLKAAATRNKCIEVSRGEYIVIQDADDYSSPNRIERLLNEIESSNYDFVSSAAYLFRDNTENYMCIQTINIPLPKPRDFLWGLPFIHAATIFKRECIIAIKGYRIAKETARGQDYDMFMRLYAYGYRGKNITEPLYWIRTNEDLLKRKLFSSAFDECRIRYKGFKALHLMPLGYLYMLKPFFAFFIHCIKLLRYILFIKLIYIIP